MISHYTKFISCFAEKANVLSSLFKKEHGGIIVWTQSCQDILHNIKSSFLTPPILRLPDYSLAFITRNDANKTAISGCLGHVYSGILYLCLYISRKLNIDCGIRGSAVIFTIIKLKKYLRGKQFVLQSDNQPLKVITSGAPKNYRTASWALILKGNKLIVTHIPVNTNCLADVLSRL